MGEFVEVSTAELVGPALDWAVATAMELEEYESWNGPYWLGLDGEDFGSVEDWIPSTDWSQGGPLIEKYKLDLGAPMETKRGPWNASTEWGHPLGQKGETPLIAACRAIVASVFGDTVTVPRELMP